MNNSGTVIKFVLSIAAFTALLFTGCHAVNPGRRTIFSSKSKPAYVFQSVPMLVNRRNLVIPFVVPEDIVADRLIYRNSLVAIDVIDMTADDGISVHKFDFHINYAYIDYNTIKVDNTYVYLVESEQSPVGPEGISWALFSGGHLWDDGDESDDTRVHILHTDFDVIRIRYRIRFPDGTWSDEMLLVLKDVARLWDSVKEN